MARPWGSAIARFGQHGRIFAENGLSEELSGAPEALEHRCLSTLSEQPQNRKRNHPRPRVMDTSRVDGVEDDAAMQHERAVKV